MTSCLWVLRMSTDGLALQSFLHEDNDKQCVWLSGVWLQLCCCCWCLGPFVWKLLTPQLNCQQCPCHHHQPDPANCWVDNYTHQRGVILHNRSCCLKEELLCLAMSNAYKMVTCAKLLKVIGQMRMLIFPSSSSNTFAHLV